MPEKKVTSVPKEYQSPAKPTTVPSPNDGHGGNFFCFYTNGVKSNGVTPGGTTKVPLDTHEGGHHPLYRSPGDSLYKNSNDFYTFTSFKKKYSALKLAFTELKLRVDSDYEYALKGKLDQGHYNATYLAIHKCMHMLQEMVGLDKHLKDFDVLLHLNRAISTPCITYNLYNPIDLLDAYSDLSYLNYRPDLVDLAYQNKTPITEADTLAFAVDTASLTTIGVPAHGVPVEPQAPSGFHTSLHTELFAEIEDDKTMLEGHSSSSSSSSSSSDSNSTQKGSFEAVESAPTTTHIPFEVKPFTLTSSTHKRQKLIKHFFETNTEDPFDRLATTNSLKSPKKL